MFYNDIADMQEYYSLVVGPPWWFFTKLSRGPFDQHVMESENGGWAQISQTLESGHHHQLQLGTSCLVLLISWSPSTLQDPLFWNKEVIGKRFHTSTISIWLGPQEIHREEVQLFLKRSLAALKHSFCLNCFICTQD